jgi:lipopolysaccharide/colanic/teichoic acid biosynthesis glycosyltransferase
MDIIGALIGLFLLSLFFIPIAVAIKMTSRGPVIFKQQRLTRDEHPFDFYKFRTMDIDHPLSKEEMDHINEMAGPLFKSRLDPRITTVGRILRKFSLDEMPQFINVLKGDMSLVGPRPPLKHEVDNYEPWQRRRLSVRAGMTGPWQIQGRSNLDFYHMVELDIEWIDNPSILRDLKILLLTLPAVVLCKGAW